MPNNDEYVEQTQTGPGVAVWIKAVAVTLVVCVIGTFPCTAWAKEKVIVAIISASFYAPWYIVREKDLAQGIDLDIRIIEGIQEKNAAISAGKIQCMLNTLDTMVLARASGLPIKVIAIPAMSFGLDEMVVTKEIKSVADFPGKSYGADYGYLNHMWMLLTLKRAGIPFDALNLVTMLPQESAAGFVSGGIDIDVNYKPFSSLSLQRPGSYVLKSSFTDKTWERGLISESITCNEVWLKEKPEIAKELLRAWFEAVDWWNRHPDEGNEIIARGLDWPVADVRLTQHGAIMLTLNQNLGAFGIRDGKPVCKSLPEGAPRPSSQPSGWGKILFGQEEDCVVGYVTDTWKLFNNIYIEAGVADRRATPEDGIDMSILEALDADGYTKMYSSNLWIGRVGP
jgi:NitT/TauT family transport system substrate-binding protein